MKVVTLTVDNSSTLTLTVNDMASNIDILGYYTTDTLQVDFNWTAIPAGLTINAAGLQVTGTAISLTGTVTADGTTGTASVTFELDLSTLTANVAYVVLISVTNSDGFSKTWKGDLRVRQG